MLLCSLFAPAATAGAKRLDLAPPSTEVAFRAYALGILPTDGRFARFGGTVDFDPGAPGRCAITLTVQAASLQMADQAVRDDVVSPSLLDAGTFPTMSYRGGCAAGAVQGELTLHGQTHPLALTLARDGGRLVATGMIRRADWGITGHPVLAGPTIRIRVSIPMPEGIDALMPSQRTRS